MTRDLAFVARVTPSKFIKLFDTVFPALDHVDAVPIAEATHMRPRDPVLWLEHNGHARCYPWWAMDNYHMVNDVVGGTPIWVAF